jgi:hypothetical protein
MTETASDFLIKRLIQWGIRRIFGYPGDGINGIIGAIQRAGDAIHYVQVRHEEMAAFMACAHAKFTGEVGVCLATSGPGAIHLLNGLYESQSAQMLRRLHSIPHRLCSFVLNFLVQAFHTGCTILCRWVNMCCALSKRSFDLVLFKPVRSLI